MAQQTGSQTTAQAINQTRNIRDVDAKIAYYDPDAAPLITMLNALKGRRRGISTSHAEWYERDRLARWATVDGQVAASAASTTVNVTDGTSFVPGDCFIVAPATGSFGVGELVRVTAVATNALTVARNVGGSGLQVMADGADLRIIGPMFEEYSAFPTQKRTVPSRKETYLQIIRTPTSYSNTAIASRFYGTMNERDQAHTDDMVEHKQKMNSVLIWGQASQSLSGGPTGNPIRSTMGLVETITTNVHDVGGMLTYKKFVEWSRSVFRYGSKRRVLAAAPIICEAIQAWGHSHMMVTPQTTSFGMTFDQVKTPHGTFAVVKDWMLENGPSGNYGYGQIGFGLDMDQIQYLYLNGNGVNRDTKVYLDQIKDGADGKSDEVLTEFGFKTKLEKHHGILANVSDYIA